MSTETFPLCLAIWRSLITSTRVVPLCDGSRKKSGMGGQVSEGSDEMEVLCV